MIYLNEDIETLDVRTALAAVSEQRRQKVLQYRQIHDQRQSLAVYLLLCEALEKEYGIIEQPEFSYGAHGKPFLANHPDIHFNFSHCHHAVLCVVDKVPVIHRLTFSKGQALLSAQAGSRLLLSILKRLVEATWEQKKKQARVWVEHRKVG